MARQCACARCPDASHSLAGGTVQVAGKVHWRVLPASPSLQALSCVLPAEFELVVACCLEAGGCGIVLCSMELCGGCSKEACLSAVKGVLVRFLDSTVSSCMTGGVVRWGAQLQHALPCDLCSLPLHASLAGAAA